jgi:hypothetical protein
MSTKHSAGAVREIKKGNFEKSIALIIATLIQKFEADNWRGARISDLIQLLVLLRGVMIKNTEGKAPVDEWLVSVSKRVDAKIKKAEDSDAEEV